MTRYLNQLHENTAPVSGDYLLSYDASATAGDEDRWVNVSKFGVLANAGTWTATQTLTPSATNVVPMIVNMPASTSVNAFELNYNAALRMRMVQNATRSQIIFADFDNTNDIGPHVNIGRNNNASTPAAGFVYLMARSATQYAVWPDNSGNLRIGTSLPTSANDTTGTVVGTQTSSRDSKNILGDVCSPAEALRSLRDAAKSALRKFTYKSGAFNGEEFDGLVVDFAPRYGMDRDAEHPAGKSLNPITLFNDLLLAIDYLAARVEALEGV